MSREGPRTAAELPRVGKAVGGSARSREARRGLWSSEPQALQPQEAPVTRPVTLTGSIGVVGMKMNEGKETAPNLRIFAFLYSFSLLVPFDLDCVGSNLWETFIAQYGMATVLLAFYKSLHILPVKQQQKPMRECLFSFFR